MSHQHTNNGLGFGEKSISSYVIGFGLSLVLTLIAFYCVTQKVLNGASIYVALAALAITQLIVQSICFIRLNRSDEGSWNLLPFFFVLVIIVFLAGGSLWIMYNLNHNVT